MQRSQKTISNYHYNQFISQMQDGVLFGSLNTQRILDCNQAFVDLTGYTKDELLHFSVDDLFVNQSHYVIGLGDQRHIGEGSLKGKNGEIMLIEMSGFIVDHKEDIFGFLIRDVTEQKAKVKSLQSRQDILAFISKIATRMMNVICEDLNPIIKNVLMEIADFSGVDRVYLFEYADFDLSSLRNRFFWPEGFPFLASSEDFFDNFSETSADFLKNKIQSKQPFIMDKRDKFFSEIGFSYNGFIKQGLSSYAIIPIDLNYESRGFLGLEVKTGDYEWSYQTLNLFHVLGEILLSAIIYHRQQINLTRSERNYKQLINSMALGILIIGPEKVMLSNELMNKVFNINSNDPIDRFYEIFSPSFRKDLTSAINKVNKNGENLEFLHTEVTVSGKNKRYLEIFLQKEIYDYEPATIIVINDLTIRKELEQDKENNLRYSMILNQVSRLAASTQNKQKTLQLIADSLGEILDADGCYITLWDEARNVPIPGAAYGPYKSFYPTIKKEGDEPTITEAVLAHQKTIVVEDTENSSFVSSRIAKMFPSKSMIGIPMIVEGRKIGAALISFNSYHTFSVNEIERAEALAGPLALALLKAQSHEDLENAYEETLLGWAKAIELREKETKNHSERVSKFSVLLGEKIGLSGELIVSLRRGAFLHDIGKMGIPDDILLKPGKLSNDEMAIMRKHSEYGYNLIKDIHFLKDSNMIALYHHERWDGTGYPEGLKGEEIPLLARIFSIVDVWDALSNERPYKKAWEKEAVLSYLKNQAGKQFDPQLTKHFLELINIFSPEDYENIFKLD